MAEPLYTARLENEGGLRNLIVTINDRENDCNLGWDTDSDADVWLQIGHLWIAAPVLLAVLGDARDAIESLPEDALGTASRTEVLPSGEAGLMEWAIRDELLDKINKAIAKVKGE